MKKAVAYYRYSSDRQSEQSIEGQMRSCHEFAEREGIMIVSEYIDRAISATTDHRPQFQRMISDCRHLDIDYVIVYKLDRFARNRYDSAVYKAKLKQRGIRLLSAMEKITDSPEGIIMEGLLEAMNEYYSAELSQKIRRGMRESIIKGKYLGGTVCLGYKVGADNVLEIDERGAAVVRLMFSLYQSGKTLAEITAEVNAAGYTTARGKPFNKNAIGKILRNERYTGHFSVKGIEEEGICPQIIEQSVFDEVNAKLETARQKHRHHKGHEYILSGLLYCGDCGERMTGSSGTARSGKLHTYYKCSCRRVSADLLEEAVLSAIDEYLHSDAMKSVARVAYKAYREQIEDHSELDAARKELSAVDKKLGNAVEAVLSGLNSPAVSAKIAELEEQKKGLLAKIEELSASAPELTEEMFEAAVCSLAGTPSAALLTTVVKRIELFEDHIAVYFRLFDVDGSPPESISRPFCGSCKGASVPPYSPLYEHGTLVVSLPFNI